MIKSLEQLMDILESNSGHFAVRGISGVQGTIEYTKDQYMDYSIDDWDGRDISYHDDLPLLNGTCGITVSGTMWDDDVQKAVDIAKNYTDCNKVCLIYGSDYDDGTDDKESIISNDGDPARFFDYITF